MPSHQKLGKLQTWVRGGARIPDISCRLKRFDESDSVPSHPFAAGWLLASLVAAGCALPSDQSGEMVVAIDAPSGLVVLNTSMRVNGHISRRSSSGASESIPGAEITWRSSDPSVATVAGASDGSATVTGLRSGTAEIQATATGFAGAEPATLAIRVANSVEIDSVVPAVVRYGDRVNIFGVGLANLARVSMGEADLIPDETTFSGERSGLGRLDFWVPYPATTARAAAVTLQGATALAPAPTTVLATDLYHELGEPPPLIDLTGPPIRPPDTLFYNPALALTVGEQSDGFRFALPTAGRAITITISTETPAVTLFDPVVSIGPKPVGTALADGDPSLWAIGVGGQICRGIQSGSDSGGGAFIQFPRPVPRTGPVTVVRALKDLPAGDLLLGVLGDPPGRYSVTVQDGYKTADPRILPDRFEENDHCLGADLNAGNPATSIDLPFADTLTIDNPYDVDWFRITIPGDLDDGPNPFLTVKVAARPFAAADSSNLGILLLGEFGVSAEAHGSGSTETLNAEVSPGDHYLIVLDEAGVATRYSLCIAVGSDCQFVPGSED
jgi:hypothetical protein